jgi:hypothetical protein
MRWTKGKILQVRLGYNPNSSSIGANVQILIWSAAFATVLTVFISAMIRGFRRWKGDQNDPKV